MSDAQPGGSHSWKPGSDPDSWKVDAAESDQPGLAGELDEDDRPSNVPLVVMAVSIVALLVTIGVVGFLVSRSSQQAAPSAPASAEPTGVPELPVRVGEYSRDPGNAAPPPDFGVDRSVQTSSAIFRRNGQPSLVVVAARPITDPQQLLEQIKTRAIRPVGQGLCGRDANDLDVCAARNGRTAVFAEGLRGQTTDEIMAATVQILNETK